MRALLIRASAICLASLACAVPATAQPYVYSLVDTYDFNAPQPTSIPVLQIRSGTTLALLGSLSLGSEGASSDIVLGPDDRKLYLAVSSSKSDIPGAVYVVN